MSAQLAGICCGNRSLKTWDPQRYGPLLHPGDDFSYDIFSQAIEALRDPAHNGTSGGRRVDAGGETRTEKARKARAEDTTGVA